ncbi:Oligosaccharyltransferase subunit Ribophorin II [compost metagenome]
MYAPRKTITHVFADPAKRAPETMSTLFSAIVVVPLGLFLISLLRVGFNFNLYPGGISSILALVFIGLLAAMLYVLARFFIDVTFFPTLYQLCALGVATILVGTKVLSSVAEKRTLTQSQ